MKTITCARLGGPCETAFTAATPEEMMDKGWKHVEEKHPEIVAQMKTMTKEQKEAWQKDFDAAWNTAAEV